MHDGDALRTYLWLVAGRGTGDGHLELRVRRPGGMRSEFFPAADLARPERRIRELGPRADVYLGVALRRETRGTADAVSAAWLAWVDCDSAASTARLATLPVPPSFTVASGSPGHVHAYWILDRPLDAEPVRALNHRLAIAVGSDERCCDPARILRPPETLNHKDHSARRVRMLDEPSAQAVDPTHLGTSLPTPTLRRARRTAPTRPQTGGHDALRSISAREYVPALTGRTVGRDGKVACPFHDDHTPSLHAYSDPDRGWYCFGCGKGGSIYDFAAGLWGMQTHGRDFLRLRDRLRDEFGHVRAHTSSRSPGLSL